MSKNLLNRRDFLRVAALAGTGLIVASCAKAKKKPGDEKVLRVQAYAAVPDLSPLRGGGHPVWHLHWWWAAPMYADAEGKIHAYVFNEWNSNDDFTVWTFKIDPKAKFSDGKNITADDVKGAWELCARPGTKHQRVTLFLTGIVGFKEMVAGQGNEMPGIVVKDKQTVEVTLEASNPVFFKKVASNLIPPVPVKQAVGADGEEVVEWWHVKNKVACSGPYMPTAMDLDAGTITMVPNPHFWMGTPKLDRVEFIAVDDASVSAIMLKSGELDCGNMSGDIPIEEQDAFYGPFVSPTKMPGGNYFWLNPNDEPTSDINVRKALIMAVDAKEVWRAGDPSGRGLAASQQLLEGIPGAADPDLEPHAYDPEAAKKALAASSYGSAENMPKILMAGVYAGVIPPAEYIAERWRQVLGITAVEMKQSFDEYKGPEKIAVFRDDVGAMVLDAPSMLLGSIHSSSSNAQNKLGGFKDPEIDRLIEEALAKGVDDPDRVKLAQEAQRRFHDLWLCIPWNGKALGVRGNCGQHVVNHKPNLDRSWYETWNVDLKSE
jgi:peptide/nickel transport system substrate-binding protein